MWNDFLLLFLSTAFAACFIAAAVAAIRIFIRKYLSVFVGGGKPNAKNIEKLVRLINEHKEKQEG
jgi:hypothetical protein